MDILGTHIATLFLFFKTECDRDAVDGVAMWKAVPAANVRKDVPVQVTPVTRACTSRCK